MGRGRPKWIVIALVALSPWLLRAQDAGEAPLEAGTVRSGRLGPGARRVCPAVLDKGDDVKVVAQQMGVDLVLTVLDPDGTELAEVDSPNGAFVPEPWAGEVPKGGRYLFEVSAPDPKSEPGAFEIRTVLRLAADEYFSHKIVSLEPGFLERFRGNFEVAPGRVLFVGPMAGIFAAGGKDILYFRDSETLRTAPLYPASATRFFSGPDLGEPYPPEDEFVFTLNAEGAPESLVWTPRGGAPVKAEKVDPFRYEQAAFESGGSTLKGYVLVPEGKGPFPAVPQVNGSQGSRADAGPAGEFFVRQGFALMAFDKREAGKSTGLWSEVRTCKRHVPGYWETMADWLKRRAGGARQVGAVFGPAPKGGPCSGRDGGRVA